MAITALCIAGDADNGRLSYTDTLAIRLPSSGDVAGHPRSPHRPDHDRTALAPCERHQARSGRPAATPASRMSPGPLQSFATKALATPSNTLGAAPGTTPHFYNNVNYLLLGMIHQEVAGDAGGCAVTSTFRWATRGPGRGRRVAIAGAGLYAKTHLAGVPQQVARQGGLRRRLPSRREPERTARPMASASRCRRLRSGTQDLAFRQLVQRRIADQPQPIQLLLRSGTRAMSSWC